MPMLKLALATTDFQGYFQFRDERGQPYGSFEVFQYGGDRERVAGYYWIACFPGCLPDGDPIGPFPTAEGAYLSAIGD